MNKQVMQTYANSEPSISLSLANLYPMLNPNFGLISEIIRERQYYDEPKFWHFSANVNNNFIKRNGFDFKTGGSGCSFFSKHDALLKCLAEVVERFSNSYFSEKFITIKAALRDVEKTIVPIESFARYSNSQLKMKKYSKFVFASTSILNWTTCESLTSNDTYLIPCNFVYLSYINQKKEPMISPIISTGVAAGWTLASAILRGLYEAIERDAYMIAYLKKIQYPKINLDNIKDKRIRYILDVAKKYQIEMYCLDITTNIGVPVICAIVVDKSGIGKAVSVGLKSNINKFDAIVGAITEAFHTKGWIRKIHEMDDSAYEKEIQKAKDPHIIARGLFWYDVKRIKKLDYWLRNNTRVDVQDYQVPHVVREELELVVSKLLEYHIDIYWKDITVDKMSHLGLRVVKVITPQLQPLTFDDEYQPQGGQRLKDVPEASGCKYIKTINTFPHPFL